MITLHDKLIVVLICFLNFFAACTPIHHFETEASPEFFYGVNLGAAGFNAKKIPGKHTVDYLWPDGVDVQLYADSMGVNVLRIPFLWERMQPVLYGELDKIELSRLDDVIDAASLLGITVVLDVHNFGLYHSKMVGTHDVPSTALAHFWVQMAGHYREQNFVAFGLMNEPYKHKAREWAAIAQEVIYAIRSTGAKQMIMVPGTYWSGAHSWFRKAGEMSNAEALGNIKDPEDNFVFEVHQYFDADSSGTKPACVSEDIGVRRLEKFTSWLKHTGNNGFWGEFGASPDPVCLKALEKSLMYIAENDDVWKGWTYWAAAKWFGNYMFNIYPPDVELCPQVKVLMDMIEKTEKLRSERLGQDNAEKNIPIL